MADLNKITHCSILNSDTENIQVLMSCWEVGQKTLPDFFNSNLTEISCIDRAEKVPKSKIVSMQFQLCFNMHHLPDLRSFKNLRFLNIASNQLKNIRTELLSELPLEELDASNNSLTGLQPFRGFSKLKRLHLSFNPLGFLPDDYFENMELVEFLDLEECALKDLNPIACGRFANLNTILLANNRLANFSLHVFVRSFYTLETIDLYSNSIENFEECHRDMFPNLKNFYIAGNVVFCPDLRGYFTTGHWFGHLNLIRGKNISSITEANEKNLLPVCIEKIKLTKYGDGIIRPKIIFKKKTPIDMRGEFIEHALYDSKSKYLKLFCLQNATNTNFFDEKNTEFTCRNIDGKISRNDVESIRLFNCKMDSLPSFRSFKNVVTLDVTKMKLINLPESSLQSMPHLTKFIVRRNRLTGVNMTFSHLKKLQILDLSHNPLQIIQTNNSFDAPTSIKELFMKNCALTDILPTAFQMLLNLVSIDLSANKFKHFTLSGFSNTKKTLTNINLNNNEIKEIDDEKQSEFPKLKMMSFTRNPIPCTKLEAFKADGVWKELYLSNTIKSFSIQEINSRGRPVCIDK